MGNCEACETDQHQISETPNVHQKTASLQRVSKVPSARHSIAELQQRSQHALSLSRKPSNVLGGAASGARSKENYIATEADCHAPPLKYGQPWNRPSADMDALVSPAAAKLLAQLGPHQCEAESDPECAYLGPYVLENGAVYDGQWKFGLRHGRGKQVWRDGSAYEGLWRNNQAHGQGRLVHSDGDVYEGEWECDKDGARYEGEWRDDRQHGNGFEQWPDGTSYKGQYANSKKHGQGLFKWQDGSYFQGEFVDNAIQGIGYSAHTTHIRKYVWADGRQYVGEWANNKMHGHGDFRFPDGKRYTGYYANDKKHGHGVFEWRKSYVHTQHTQLADGSKYVGQWENGKQHGEGVVYDAQGQGRKGVWQEGKLVRLVEEAEEK